MGDGGPGRGCGSSSDSDVVGLWRSCGLVAGVDAISATAAKDEGNRQEDPCEKNCFFAEISFAKSQAGDWK